MSTGAVVTFDKGADSIGAVGVGAGKVEREAGRALGTEGVSSGNLPTINRRRQLMAPLVLRRR